MHLFSLHSPLAFLGLEPWMIAIVVPVVGMIFAAVMALGTMHFKGQERERWHQTARVALEKGQPLPPMPEDMRQEGEKAPSEGKDLAQHDVRGGMVLIAVGLGLWFMLRAVYPPLGYVGAIPGFIGVALLLYAIGRAMFVRKADKRDDLPGRS